MIARAWLCLLFSLCAALPAAAQDYPAGPVKFVVPFPPGGPLDVPARLVARKLSQRWGKPVVVENQAGASGSIGANSVARAAPDGTTVLVTVDIPLTMYAAVAKKLPYDPQADFRPVGIYSRFQNGLFVNKGAAPAMQAALSGEVDMMFGPTTQGAPQVRAGKLKALGVTGPRPSPVLPGVKPLAEQGFPGLVLQNWFGVFVPAKTPDAVMQRIASGWRQVLADPEVRDRLIAMDLQPAWEDADATRKAIAEDPRRWADLAKRAGIASPG